MITQIEEEGKRNYGVKYWRCYDPNVRDRDEIYKAQWRKKLCDI